MKNEYGKYLKKWRKARGLTQKELAEKMEFSSQRISEVERSAPHSTSGGFVRPSEEFVEKAAIALDRPVEEGRALAGYNPSPAPLTMAEVSELLKQNPGQGVFIDAANPTGFSLIPNSVLHEINAALQKIAASLPKDSKS